MQADHRAHMSETDGPGLVVARREYRDGRVVGFCSNRDWQQDRRSRSRFAQPVLCQKDDAT